MSKTQQWFLITALWLILLFTIFSFYWFQLRPVNIRKICSKNADRVSSQISSGFYDVKKTYQAVYSDCLDSYGVKR